MFDDLVSPPVPIPIQKATATAKMSDRPHSIRTSKRLAQSRTRWLWLAILVAALRLRVCAQIDEFVPEVDLHYKIARDVRVSFQAKETREGGEPTQAEFGPSIEFYAKPLVRLKKITEFDLDDAKPRPLVLAIGYRYLPSPNIPAVNRIEPVATAHFPLSGSFLLSDRNRADLDWLSGKFSWRYRNLLKIERRIRILSYHPGPYAAVEVFYQSRYNKFSNTAIYLGCLFPIRKRFEFDPYYEHQNYTGKSPNQQLDQFGLRLNVLFS